MNCDLHTHSTYSDGSFSPAEIIAQAKRLGLAVALTDHNTVAGLSEFLQAAEQQAVTAVAGVELSTEHGEKELHLLGLFIEPEAYDKLTALLRTFREGKERSNAELVERLNKAGYRVDYTAIRQGNPGGNINRAHVAKELLKGGYVASVKEAFDTILDEAAGFYVPPPRLQLTDAIRFLREIHALPVLAHPLQELSEEELRRILPEVIGAGLVGMETRHESYGEESQILAGRIAAEFGLLESGGSDFHGEVKPDIALGTGRGNLSVPLRFYELLKEKHAALCAAE